MSEADDSGLPEESQGKLEQSNAVPVEGVGPWTKPELNTNRQIFENIDDLFKYGEDIILNYQRSYQIVIVIDNSGWSKLLYPSQPHYWVIEKFALDPTVAAENPDRSLEIECVPLYEKMVEWAEQDITADVKPAGSVQVSTYQGVPVYLPDPLLDYSRPETQISATTGAATGATVITTTTVKPNTAGGVTVSETVPAEVAAPTNLTDAERKWLGGADPTDPYILARMKAATGATPSIFGKVTDLFGGLQRLAALSTIAKTSAANVLSGNIPSFPNNPPAGAGVSGAGSTPPRSVPYQDAILRQARAAAAAPKSTVAALTAGAGRGNGAAEVAQRAANTTVTAPTTVTQSPSTPTTANTSATLRPPNVYVYEPLTPGFDRYDFNTGKKVYTPDAGPSRTVSSQPVVPQLTPRVPSTANDLGVTSPTLNNATTSAIAQRVIRPQ